MKITLVDGSVLPTTVYSGDFVVYDSVTTANTVTVTNATISGRVITLTLKTDGTYAIATNGKVETVAGGADGDLARVKIVASPAGTFTGLGTSYVIDAVGMTNTSADVTDKIAPKIADKDDAPKNPVVVFNAALNKLEITVDLTEVPASLEPSDFVIYNGTDIIIPNTVVAANSTANQNPALNSAVKLTINDVTATGTTIDFSKSITVGTKNVTQTVDAAGNKLVINTTGVSLNAESDGLDLQDATTLKSLIKIVSAGPTDYDLQFKSAVTLTDYVAAGGKIGLIAKQTNGSTVVATKLVVLSAATIAADTDLLAAPATPFNAADGDKISYKIVSLSGGFDSGWTDVVVDELDASKFTLTLGTAAANDTITVAAASGLNASATYTIKVTAVTGTGVVPNPDSVSITTAADGTLAATQFGTSVTGVDQAGTSTATLLVTDANGTQYMVSLAEGSVN